jgi:hypothetical protein
MANFTSPMGLTHGFLDPAHTSNITLGWTPATLPTPFPVVIVSALVSLIIAFVGWKTAVTTWSPPDRRPALPPPPDFDSWRERMQWNMTVGRQMRADARAAGRTPPRGGDDDVPFQGGDDVPLQPPKQQAGAPDGRIDDVNPADRAPLREPREGGAGLFVALATPSRWDASTRNKISVLVSLMYNTLRTIVAAVTTLDIVITHRGTHAAVSSLFLLYLSMQTFISNRQLPRAIVLVILLDLFLAGLSFLLAMWDLGASTYGDATLIGGNCPIFAPDCDMQAPHWSQVGCGATVRGQETQLSSTRDTMNPYHGRSVYPPYSGGNVNDQWGNRLRGIEVAVGVIGSIWTVVTLLGTLYEAWRVFASLETWAHLLWPVPFRDEYKIDKKTGKQRKRLGWTATSMFALFSLGGGFVVVILSIAGHVSGETKPYGGAFIDGFGPPILTNITRGPSGVYTTSGGNATSWTDCFNITTFVSSNGFFDIWLSHNEQMALRPLRILTLL